MNAAMTSNSSDPATEPMRGTPSALQQTLALQQIAKCDTFTGNEEAIGRTSWGRVFGGQVLAQSLAAAFQTIPGGFDVHSLHGYFLLAGESGVELLFEVERVRDGRSMCTRVVKALQRNRAIFLMLASFHRPEWGPEFRTPDQELFAVVASRGCASGRLPSPEELLARGVQPEPCTRADNVGDTESLSISSGDWWILRYVRHKGKLPDGPAGLHQSIFAWMTDSSMVNVVCKPHLSGHTFSMLFSLDHSIHFHRPFRVDQWLLFHSQSTVSSGARGLAHCEVFTLEGLLVATVTQEALTRVPLDVAERELEREFQRNGNLISKL